MFGQLLKPFIFCHLEVLMDGFVDVDAMWQWHPPDSIFSLISLPFSPLFLLSPLLPTAGDHPVIAVVTTLNPGPDPAYMRPPLLFP
jgi:hypothetical protein